MTFSYPPLICLFVIVCVWGPSIKGSNERLLKGNLDHHVSPACLPQTCPFQALACSSAEFHPCCRSSRSLRTPELECEVGDRLETTWGWLEGAGGDVEVVEGAGVDDVVIASDEGRCHG